MRRWRLSLTALALALVCYYLPWYTHATAAFTLQAYDLAEWASLHPAVRAESPALLTSFLLRLPQMTLVLAAALLANGSSDPRARWLVRGVAVMVALRFLPPREFFGNASADPNYRQMAVFTALSVAGIVGAAVGASLPVRWQTWATVGVLLAGVLAGWWGLSRTYPLLDNFEIGVQVGSGVVGYTVFCLLAVGGMMETKKAVDRCQSPPSMTPGG